MRIIVILIAVFLIIFGVWYYLNNTSTIESPAIAQQVPSSASSPAGSDAGLSSSSQSSSVNTGASVSSLASSVKSLSGVRVDPLPEIAFFLRQLDNAAIPKITLPTPKRDFQFNYGKAKPAELKEKALADDPYAAYFYAEYLIKNGVRTITDKGDYSYEADHKKRILTMDEARKFYIRGFRGGIASIAEVLSRLYAHPSRGGNRIESLAWRKISFAVGEGQRYECLRNSTTCVVKDFNNLNRLELFYPCLSASEGDSCTQNDYDTAMMLAMEYVDSFDFAIGNKVGH